MDFKSVFENIKTKGENLQKGFNDITNFFTALDYIKGARKIAVVGHDNIDGDSLGSTMAIKKWIENRFQDKEVIAYTNRKPSSVFDFLKSDIQYGENLLIDKNMDLIIVLDSANLERLGDLYTNNKELFDDTSKIINIDHHISNTKFGAINIVIEKAATAQIIYEILSLFDNKLTKLVGKNGFDEKVATYLLLGIITDTNNFTTPNADSDVLTIAAELLKKGAAKDEIIKNVYQNKTISQLKLQSLVLDRITKIENEGIKSYYSYYINDDLEKLGIDTQDPGVGKELVSLLLQINDTDFVSLWKIQEDKTSISFRAKEYDVNKLAAEFGGGGHKLAAGAKIDKKIDPKEIENIIIEKLNNLKKEDNKNE